MKVLSKQTRRLVAIVLIGGGLVGMVFAVEHFWFRRPIGEGPAGPAVPRQAFARSWISEEVVLLGIGDSVTAGFGARRGYSYFDRLARNPSDEYADMSGISLAHVFSNLRTRNLAVSGTTSIQHVEQQLPQLDGGLAKLRGVVVLTTGGNDVIHDYGRSPPCEGAMYGASLEQARPWIEAFDGRLGSMVDRIYSAFPQGCDIFLANIYDPTDDVGDIQSTGLPPWADGSAILRAYNEVISRCASSRSFVHLVDLHSTFLGHGIHCTQPWHGHYDWDDPHYWYFDNLEDPNERGYDAIRRLFLLKIAEVFAPDGNEG